MGRYKKWTQTVKDRYEFYFVEIKKRLDFKDFFGNSAPVHIEIGAGRGEFIGKKAKQLPDVNFLAIELQIKRVRQILLKLDPQEINNVKVANMFIDQNITNLIPPKSIETIYIQHPDPWPKRKHHKNRLIQPEFIDALAKIIKPNGLVKIATDHPEYAQWIVKKFSESDKFESIFKNGFTKEPYDGHIETYFEEKKKEEGFLPIFMHYRKV